MNRIPQSDDDTSGGEVSRGSRGTVGVDCMVGGEIPSRVGSNLPHETQSTAFEDDSVIDRERDQSSPFVNGTKGEGLTPVRSGFGTDAYESGTGEASREVGAIPERTTAPAVACQVGVPKADCIRPVPSTGDRLKPGHQTGEFTDEDWRAARAAAEVCDRFLELTTVRGLSLRAAAQVLGRSPASFSGADSMLGRYQAAGVEGLLPRRRNAGRSVSFDVPDWFVPAASHFYLLSNRNRNCGSVPEAVRRTISLPVLPVGWKESERRALLRAVGMDEVPSCPASLRDLILERQRAGQPLVPERLSRLIVSCPAVVQTYRNKTESALRNLCVPGGQRLVSNEDGTRRLMRAGDCWEADDATINFPVCVPWTIGGDPCSDRWGVRVGRFQWLVAIDAGTSFVTGYSYTARPRSSYRAEDVLSLFRVLCREHGIPKRWRLERGVWKSNRVTEAIKLMGAVLDTVYSPHAKVFIEGLFNVLWTKLSIHFPGSQVGRFRGENEAATDLLVSCQRGARDPRKHFPMLSDAIAAMNEAIGEKNQTPMQTQGHGRWVPAERWVETGGEELRRMDPAGEWLFSPFVREWTVTGMLVGGRVRMFEEMSVPFDFAADFLPKYHGARVKVYFDPSAPMCEGMICLAESFAGQEAGAVLGMARQVNETAGYVRALLGYGSDTAGAGRVARQQAAAALRREVRAVVPTGRGGAESEERDGVGQVARVAVDRGTGGSTRGGVPVVFARGQATPPVSGPDADVEAEDRAELAARMERAAEMERELMMG